MIRNILLLFLLLTQLKALNEHNTSNYKKLSEELQIEYIYKNSKLPVELLKQFSEIRFSIVKEDIALSLMRNLDIKISVENIHDSSMILNQNIHIYDYNKIPEVITFEVDKISSCFFPKIFLFNDRNLDIEIVNNEQLSSDYYGISEMRVKNKTHKSIEITSIILYYKDQQDIRESDDKFIIKPKSETIGRQDIVGIGFNPSCELTQKNIKYGVKVLYRVNGKKRTLSKIKKYTLEELFPPKKDKTVQKLKKSNEFILFEYIIMAKKAFEAKDEANAIKFMEKSIQWNIEQEDNLSKNQELCYYLLGDFHKEFNNSNESKQAYNSSLEIQNKIEDNTLIEEPKDTVEKESSFGENLMIINLLALSIFLIIKILQTPKLKIIILLFAIFFFLYIPFLIFIWLGLVNILEGNLGEGIFEIFSFSLLFYLVNRASNDYIKESSVSKKKKKKTIYIASPTKKDKAKEEKRALDILSKLVKKSSVSKKKKKTIYKPSPTKKDKAKAERNALEVKIFQECRNCSASEIKIENDIYICAYCGTAIREK